MTSRDTDSIDAVQRLRKLSLFAALDEALLTRIVDRSERRDLESGEVLVHEGAAAEDFFLVLRGRFTVVLQDKPIAEVMPGEPVGEMAFFAGGRRSATVIAARRSEVLVLTRASYDALIRETPELSSSVIAALAQRVNAGNQALPRLQPRAGRVVGVLPAGGQRLDPDFAGQLAAAVTKTPGWTCLRVEDLPDDADPERWLADTETKSGCLLVLCEAPLATPRWAQAVRDTSDLLMIALDTHASAPHDIPVSGDEAALYRSTLNANRHLILLRNSGMPRSSAAWLEDRPVGLHHQISRDAPGDFARLARFVRGEALGLVFSGGGALGTAHLGMLKALQEDGLEFDMIGGTSMGGALAGACAMGLTPDDIMDGCDTLFLHNRAMKRLTFPVHSIIEHRHFDQHLQQLYRDLDIEDLPLNMYTVATSLTRNDICILRSGPLWQAVRASSAIPGLLPPFVQPDGEVLIDGALIDNAPVTSMRDLKPGPNLVFNIAKRTDWRVRTDYAALPGRAGALKKLLSRRHGVRFPGPFSVLTRTMMVNSERRGARTQRGSDIFMSIAPMHGMGFLDWGKGRAQFEAAYRHTVNAVEAAQTGTAHSRISALHSIADHLGRR